MRVLLATDFSAHAETARDLVSNMRLPEGSVVNVVHASDILASVSAFVPDAMLYVNAEVEAQIRGEVEAFARPLGVRGWSIDVTAPFGRAADVIVAEAKRMKADLVVIGHRGRGGLATMLLGSVSAEVVDRAPCPVLVARGRQLHRLLLADDGSASAAIGADLIGSLVPLRGLPVHVVSVVDAPFPYAPAAEPAASAAVVEAYQQALPALRADHQRIARERVERLRGAGVTASFEVREGDAAAQVIEAATTNKSDCIVIGSRGQSGIERLVLGSVARGVLLNATCSVLIAHGPAGSTSRAAKADVTDEAFAARR